ncbi:MAG: hydroxylamine reductase [Thermoplasmata archaeon]|nr:hydroxylamine reductase [Thermoplasmata archaeon]
MSEEMFCFQCEQTAGGRGCMGRAGVCGKTSEVAMLQDELTSALIGLANNTDAGNPEVDSLVRRALFATLTNVDFDADSIRSLTAEVRKVSGGKGECPASSIWTAQEDIRSLKSLILFGIRGMAAYAYHAEVLGETSPAVDAMLYKALRAIGSDMGMDGLLPVVLGVGEANLECMAMLDRANTGTFGVPSPATVSRDVEPGPAIIVTGHDLEDLKAILEQTEGKGINVYTHGEMLPAHAYPELNKYPHLKGNFGTAWQNQKKEFEGVPAAVVFTTNCLMPPAESYRDRVFTSGPVAYPGTVHIGDGKDFTPAIEKALELGGFKEATSTGATFTTGFGHGFVLSVADKVIEAVKAGQIGHFFLVGGCDGAKPGRGYFREFVQNTPENTVVLTLACGKYRFNDLDLGTVAGLPRMMDMGQCNDAYGAIQVAVALANAFGCGVNDLPLSMVLSWYEQKAVCILLTLLHLGIKDIYLGPSLPAFVSSGVLDFLVQNFGIHAVGEPKADMDAMLG